MYTGTADHSLTAELVERVDVPVIASGDITSRARAQAVLATTGAAAVMVGRAAQGNPWALRAIVDEDARSRRATRSPPSWSSSSGRPCASSASSARPAS